MPTAKFYLGSREWKINIVNDITGKEIYRGQLFIIPLLTPESYTFINASTHINKHFSSA